MPKWYGLNLPFEVAITGSAFDHLCQSNEENDQRTLAALIKTCKIFA